MQLQVKLGLIWAGGKRGPNYWHKMRVVESPVAESPLTGVFIGILAATAASTSLPLHENSGGGWAELYGGEREEFSDDAHILGVPCAGTVPVPGQCPGLVLRAHNLQPLFLQR